MRRLKIALLAGVALAALFSPAGSAMAQVTTGAIVGTVSDQTGAVVAGASVTARNKATGTTKTATSGQDGQYELPLLQPGEYEVTVDAANFAKLVQQTVTVNVGTKQTLNMSLKPSGTEEVVTVTGEAGAVIETTDTVIKGVVDNRQVKDLPLSGRTFANLAILVPSAKPIGAFDPTKARIGTISIAGSSGRDANVSVDGGDNKDNVVGGALQNYTTEGIQEFVVNTQNFQPDTGRSAGGAITVVTKSGSNEFHGSFVMFERNDRFNARAFNNKEGDEQAFDRQNIAGSFGGPLIKDKLFIFGAAEYTRENVSVIVSPDAVKELQALNTFAKRGVIPGVASVDALSLIPTPFRDTQFQIRGDYKYSDNSQFLFRYGNQQNKIENDQISNLADVTQGAKTTNKLRSALFQHTYTFGGSKVNVFTYQFSKFINRINPNTQVISFAFPGVLFGTNQNVPQSSLQNKHQFRDSFSFLKGRHSWKFGVDYVYTPVLGGTFDFLSVPTFEFNTNPSDILAQGKSLSDIEFVDDVLLGNGNSRVDQKVNQFSWYVQDTFRVTPRLTVNYGVRYDADFGFYNFKGGTQATNRATVALQKIGVLPQGDAGLPQDDKNNFSPRIGIAWDPRGDGKAVLRASYGLFYDQIFQNVQFFGLQQSGESIYALAIFDPLRLGKDPLPVRTTNLPDLRAGDTGRLIDPNITTPYTQQSSVNFQYEFAPNYVFDTNYTHILGLHGFMNVELNSRVGPSDGTFVFGKAEPRVLAANFAKAGLPALSRVRSAASINRSRYDGWTIGVTRRYSGTEKFKYQYGFHYTLSRALSYGSGLGAEINDFGFIFEDPINFFRKEDLGRTYADARHRAVFNGIVDMPYQFQVSTIIQAESGRPFGIRAGQDLNGDGLSSTDVARVDANGNFIVFRPGDRITGTPVGVGAGSGRPYFQVDLRVSKTFTIKERVKIIGYVEFFNLFNRANVGNAFGSADFRGAASILDTLPTGGRPTRKEDFAPNGLLGSSFGAGTTIGVPFQTQFGFRVSF